MAEPERTNDSALAALPAELQARIREVQAAAPAADFDAASWFWLILLGALLPLLLIVLGWLSGRGAR